LSRLLLVVLGLLALSGCALEREPGLVYALPDEELHALAARLGWAIEARGMSVYTLSKGDVEVVIYSHLHLIRWPATADSPITLSYGDRGNGKPLLYQEIDPRGGMTPAELEAAVRQFLTRAEAEGKARQ
jgi:hypothetical protein